MDRIVLAVGSAGAGKSTLANKLIGRNDSTRVSHRMLRDGTSELIPIPVPFDERLTLIDTPGLNSSNFATSVTEKVQRLYSEQKVLVMLVLSKSNPRITDYIGTFERTLGELVGSDKQFLIVWTHDGEVSEENLNDVQAKFPRGIMCYDEDVSAINAIKAHFSNAALFSPQLRDVARAAPAPRLPQPSTSTGSAPTSGTVPPASNLHRALVLGLTPTVNAQHLKNYTGVKPTGFASLVKDVLKIKKEGGPEYRNRRLMGDAVLKSTVMSILLLTEDNLIIENLETTTKPVIGNNEDCAMPQFFVRHMMEEFKKHYSNPAEIDSAHHQADMVEALLDLARTRKKGGASFAFIIMELFKLVELGHVVTKIKRLCT